ncbi:acetylcholinesterase, partial [Ixodes scapularis]
MVSGAPFMDPKFYPDNLELSGIVWSEGDRNMSQLFMQAWANFAKTGQHIRTQKHKKAEKTRSSGVDCLPFDMESFTVKVYKYFHIYTVSVEALKELCAFAGIEYAKLLEHGSTREDKELKASKYSMGPELFRLYLQRYARQFNFSLNEEAAVSALSFMYTPWSDRDNRSLLMQGYVDMLSDSYFVAPQDKTIKLMLDKGFKVYAYVLNYSLDSYPKEQYLRRSYDWDAVPHEVVDLMVSGAPFMDPKFYPDNLELSGIVWSEGDRNMSQLFMQAWANFAKTG